MVMVIALVGIGILWAIVLVPVAAEKLRAIRAADTIRSFQQNLSGLHRSRPDRSTAFAQAPFAATPAGAPKARPHTASEYARQRAQLRRQNVLAVLLVACLITLLGALVIGGIMVWANILVDALLVAYLSLLMSMQRQVAPSPRQVMRPADPYREIDLRDSVLARSRHSIY